MTSGDVLIVGAGIAGASLACWLAPHARVVMLERESQPGYHSTGRSAAMFIESYGGEQVRALTRASRAFFERPPPGFSEQPIFTPRGALFVATESQREQLEAHWALLHPLSAQARRLDGDEVRRMVPVLRPEELIGGAYEADAMDMDVHALHQGYLRAAKASGATLVCDANVIAIERTAKHWHVEVADGRTVDAPVLVNAAGAWADAIAQLAGVAPIGLEPRRRSAFVFAPPEGIETSHWPLVIGADEDWYLKPDAGLLLGSPANADATVPHDVQPDELDIATGIARIEQMTTLTIRRPKRTWAGLRSFVADGGLVGGYEPTAPSGFFWLAGQGGYGIQTSAAMGEACAALVRGLPLPQRIADFGLTAEMLAPARLGRRGATHTGQATR